MYLCEFDEYKKQIDLIKAREALENAKNEKKRVYRAGVGWTYETDQEAIREARENLKNLETDKEQENLQYQIDLLEKQNSMLDNISKNEELNKSEIDFTAQIEVLDGLKEQLLKIDVKKMKCFNAKIDFIFSYMKIIASMLCVFITIF